MKRQAFIIILLLVFTAISSCKKSSGTTTPPPVTPTEENIAFTIDIDPGTGIYAALGATQDAKITITSKMPTAGVTLDLAVRKDSDNSVVSSSTVTSTTTPFTATITNLQVGVICTATFTVTSKTTASNITVKSFKIARK